jgi:hypothetical protein
MPQIAAVRTKDDSSRETIAVVLLQDAVCLGPDGQPWSGVSLSSQEARKLAACLVSLALEIEGSRELDRRKAPDSLADLASILVFHDGSEQSHRAFGWALELASRSLATIQLTGVFGVRPDKFEPSMLTEDYEWQRGWLERLTRLYSEQATKEGIDLRTMLVSATDQEAIFDLFNSGRFDFNILPYKFSDNSSECGTPKALRRSLAEATKSKVLFCP